ncbi:hydroxyneurosporene-O-methyltransferase [Humibacillus xanthopallidus]|uniref:Hydroxyneurosporene-O-methyltransferase n=1 Tax=Humibacillus xanthopallidus TaxID=412689 RepID=A0A543PNS7_9MICO|nr:methyltransferase [Humibacillus xanthopallidus]TQN45736.1 hydroxyneurosporene-O-methyltransferase [Humibacillus xanthopallidus]
MEPRDELNTLITGLRRSAALSVAAELGISDELADEPVSIARLATRVGADGDTLHRLMRVLVALGVYAETADGRYANTSLGECLRSDVPGSMRPLARTFQDPATWAAWGHLAHSVRTGDNAFEALQGVDVWSYRGSHPQANAVFNATMASLTSRMASAVAAAHDFEKLSTVVDVGGGDGVLLGAVLDRHEHLTGTVFDLPQALPAGPPDGASESVASRWSAVSGDFFEAVPPADAYLLKKVLHDWSDDQCVLILSTCRRSLSPGGVVLVVESLLDRPGRELEAALSDLNMLVMPGGRERTTEEYDALLAAAGLRLARVLETPTEVVILEGVVDGGHAGGH